MKTKDFHDTYTYCGILWPKLCKPLSALPTEFFTPDLPVFKETLRRHLEKVFPQQELARWFDPLLLQRDEQEQAVRVYFPHPFFRNWFFLKVKNDFEKEAGTLLADLRFIYDDMRQTNDAPPLHDTASFPLSSGSLPHDDYSVDHSFDNFLVNRKNTFPINVAKKSCSVAAAGGRLPYTPLVFYGQSGSGKSHLLYSMADSLKQKGLAVYFGDISYLDRLCISPGRYAQAPERCLFLDDAQRVSVCPDLQDALAALVDSFQRSGSLLVLALDRHPSQLTSIGQKLRSRLASGLAAELKRPDLDVRLQYVQHMNASANLRLNNEQMLELCQRHQDIRSINGVLASFTAMRSLADAPPESSAFFDQLLPAAPTGKSSVSAPAIIQTVALHFRVSPEDLIGKKRDRTIAFARHTAMYLCRELLGLSLVQTGRIFGDRDHSSVLYSIKKIKEIQDSDKDRHNVVEKLRQLCLGNS